MEKLNKDTTDRYTVLRTYGEKGRTYIIPRECLRSSQKRYGWSIIITLKTKKGAWEKLLRGQGQVRKSRRE